MRMTQSGLCRPESESCLMNVMRIQVLLENFEDRSDGDTWLEYLLVHVQEIKDTSKGSSQRGTGCKLEPCETDIYSWKAFLQVRPTVNL